MVRSGYHPLECFGKLPCYGDYLEQMDHPATVELARWMREGRLHAYGSNSLPGVEIPVNATLEETARIRVLFSPPGSTAILVGIIRPSRDQVRRSFPFGLFATIPRSEFGKRWKLFPRAAVPVWDALDDTFDRLAATATKDGFDEGYGAGLVPSPVPVSEAQAAYERELGQPVASLFERSDGARLEILRKSLATALDELRKQPDRVRLELPVHRDPAVGAHDASFWLDLLERQFLLRRFEPTVFLREVAGKADRTVLLVFGSLLAADYAAVMGAATAPASAETGDAGSAEAGPEATMSYADLLSTRL